MLDNLSKITVPVRDLYMLVEHESLVDMLIRSEAARAATEEQLLRAHAELEHLRRALWLAQHPEHAKTEAGR